MNELLDELSEDDFQKLQNNFMEKNYLHFEDTEENKFVYTDIFKEYVSGFNLPIPSGYNPPQKLPGSSTLSVYTHAILFHCVIILHVVVFTLSPTKSWENCLLGTSLVHTINHLP